MTGQAAVINKDISLKVVNEMVTGILRQYKNNFFYKKIILTKK